MMQWRIELGEVIHWNDEKLEDEVQLITIDYNSDGNYPCVIIIQSNEYKQITHHKELIVEIIDKEHNIIEICDELYVLNEFQLIQLKQYAFYWRGKVESSVRFPFFRKEIERSMGLVLYYEKNIHNYTMAELLIDFYENKTVKGRMTIKVYSGETRLLKDQEYHYFTKFDFEFKGSKENGLQHYTICELNFLLTEAQAQKLCGLYIHKED